MYKIGDYYEKNGQAGIVISVDYSGTHGKIISLNEKHCNWYDADKWCRGIGNGWHMPSKSDYEEISSKETLTKIQNGLIKYGMPFCFGDESSSGTNRQSHIYWTTDGDGKWMVVFCANQNYPSFSTDYKEAEYEYVRAVKEF